jgi:ribosomal protein S20
MDFDGDKMFIILIRNNWDRIRKVLTSTPAQWEKEFAEAIPEDNQVLVTEQDILEYYSNLMIAVFAARQAIGPMVKSALRTYALRIYQAIKNGNINRWTLEKSNELQKILSAVSEILAIKMEKSFASVKNTFTGWLWVDMSKEFAKKASDFVGVLNNVSKGDMKVVSTLMNYISPRGKVSIYSEENDEWLQEDSSHPFDVLRTFVSEVKTKFKMVEPLMPWFPYLYFVRRFANVNVQKKVHQGVIPKRDGVEAEYHTLRSDVQKQHMIFSKMLDAFMSSNNILIGSELYIKYENAATAFVREVRRNLLEIAQMFEGEDPANLEKQAYTHHVFTEVMQIIIDLGIASANESHPWNIGDGKNADMEFFFALLVATKDFAYQRREDGDGYRFVDGKKSSFNRVTRTGIEMCVKGYYEVIANQPLSFFDGGDDETLLKDTPNFSLPYWVIKGNRDPYFTDYSAPGVDDSAV